MRLHRLLSRWSEVQILSHVSKMTETEVMKKPIEEVEDHECTFTVDNHVCDICGKRCGTPSFLDTWNVTLEDNDWPRVNFRRKHPKLGGKIADLEQRVKKLERTNERLISLLEPVLKASLKARATRLIEQDYKDIIKRIGDVF